MLKSPKRDLSRFIAGSIPYFTSLISCIIYPVSSVAELLCTSLLPFMFINKLWFHLYRIFFHVVVSIIYLGCRYKLKSAPSSFNKKPKSVNTSWVKNLSFKWQLFPMAKILFKIKLSILYVSVFQLLSGTFFMHSKLCHPQRTFEVHVVWEHRVGKI